jgi:hypothetical protein
VVSDQHAGITNEEADITARRLLGLDASVADSDDRLAITDY